jgi:hypothetical protein
MSWALDIEIVLGSNPILFGPGTSVVGNIISSSFRAYVEHINPILYGSCTSI